MKRLSYLFVAAIVLFSYACKPKVQTTTVATATPLNITGQITYSGAFNCFAPPSAAASAYCETSAVLYLKGDVYAASDKDIPGGSPVFKMKYNLPLNGDSLTPLTNPLFMRSKKYEDITTDPGGHYIFLTTGFDRIKDDGSFDNFNNLLYWPVIKGDLPALLTIDTLLNPTTSKGLRKYIARALATEEQPNGPAYFKVEGLAAMPNNKLIFGIREEGETYEKFNYVCKLIEVSYDVSREGWITLNKDFKLIFSFNPAAQGLKSPLGLSSIEYDVYNKRLFIAVSFEQNTPAGSELGAYIYSINEKDLRTGGLPDLMYDPKGQPLSFNHKMEGLSIVDKETLLLIADDDRKISTAPGDPFGRNANQAWYAVVKWKK